jgi:hypothetical protein
MIKQIVSINRSVCKGLFFFAFSASGLEVIYAFMKEDEKKRMLTCLGDMVDFKGWALNLGRNTF